MLSDDIRTGSRLTRQTRSQFVRVIFGKHMMTCALGAACVAIGKPYLNRDEGIEALVEQWPELKFKVDWPANTAHSYPGDPQRDLQTIIIALNDQYNWTREAIADWIDTLELPRPLEIPPIILEIPERVAQVEEITL